MIGSRTSGQPNDGHPDVRDEVCLEVPALDTDDDVGAAGVIAAVERPVSDFGFETDNRG